MMLAQSTPDAAPAPFHYEWAGLEWLRDEPAWLIGSAVAVAVVVVLSVLLHRRERSSLSFLSSGFLLFLRLAAVAGVVLFLLGPERRRAEQVTRPSRVLVLVDSSASMAMPDETPSAAATGQASPDMGPLRSRSEAALALLTEGGVLRALGETHAVSVAPTSAVGKAVVIQGDSSSPAPPGEKPPASEGPLVLPDPLLEMLQPTRADTRLGDALRQTLDAYTGEPLAGVVLLTDGRSNAGLDAVEVAAEALARDVPVMAVGFGPTRAAANLVVRDVVAPSRAYPNDEIELTVFVEQTGGATQSPSLSLSRRPADAPPEAAVLLDTAAATANEESGGLTARFKTRPDAVGRYVYSVAATPLARESRLDDNTREVLVEVVDQTTTVLLWAGGPNRDYRFLRGCLVRDDSFEVDVLLQSAPAGVPQDARTVLLDFPPTAEALDEYDVLVAFDPDWSKVGEDQVELIEQWVSQRGAGLLFAPGPVNSPKWYQRGPSEIIKKLLPVAMPERVSLLGPAVGAAAPTRPIAVELTRAGADADFLWIKGGRDASLVAWRDFPGFFQVAPTASLGPGATVFAAGSGATGSNQVVFAEQYFGAGRVFYSGVTETWRLRSEETEYFNAYWTKLLRRISQGRLLAKSPGGRLLFERDRYVMADTIVLRAIVPAADPAAPRVQVVAPGGDPISLEMQPSPTRPDAWVGRLPALHEGVYEALAITAESSAAGQGPLTARTEVVAPAAERDRPTRDVAALQKIADASGGSYYPSADAVIHGADPTPALAKAIPSKTETRTVYGKTDQEFAEQTSYWLLGLVVGSLCLEWLTRRLIGLA